MISHDSTIGNEPVIDCLTKQRVKPSQTVEKQAQRNASRLGDHSLTSSVRDSIGVVGLCHFCCFISNPVPGGVFPGVTIALFPLLEHRPDVTIWICFFAKK